MKNRQTTFFATKKDVVDIMSNIEALFQIEYVEMGMFDSNKRIKYNSLKTIPNIGYTNFGNWISLDNWFLIIKKDSVGNVREVPQRGGGMKYAVDFMLNSIAIELSIGGIYSAKENVLTGGRLASVVNDKFCSEV